MPSLTLKGAKNTATVFTHNIEETAIGQVIGMLNEPITENTTVAIMPDVHAGAGSTIGTTIRLPESKADWKVCPNVVGVDIGCSMRAIHIKDDNPDLEKLDQVVNEKVPAGQNIHDRVVVNQKEMRTLLKGLSFRIDQKRHAHIMKSCGTLGGGNHYIELGKSPDGQLWLTVHDWEIIDEFESMHNYIDIENGIIRKGATSAQAGERLIIPLNMRDGSIFATGKGNPDWNFSAPHGAGRVLSRSKAKAQLSLEDYRKTMEGIYTTSICEATLDESPFAYKESQEIIDAIADTATVDMIVKPIYNFKAH